MHAFDVLGDPVRRRILELLAQGERSSGAIGAIVQAEFGITQPAVSQHLKVLKAAGLVADQAVGTRRVYSVDSAGLAAIRDYFEQFWQQSLYRFRAAASQAIQEEK